MLDPERVELVSVDGADGSVEVFVPRRAISRFELGIVYAVDDDLSISIAQYYQSARGIPAENLFPVTLGSTGHRVPWSEFQAVKQSLDAQLAGRDDIQALAITWLCPWKITPVAGANEGMSVTSVLSLGFEDRYYNTSGGHHEPTAATPYHASGSTRPYRDFGIRPCVMIAAEDDVRARDLIDRGLAAEGTFPGGKGFFVHTPDPNRSIRVPTFLSSIGRWDRPGGVEIDYLDRDNGMELNNLADVIASGAYLENEIDVLFYQTGMTTIPSIATNTFLPGALADHVTSSGGGLTSRGDDFDVMRGYAETQMSILNWLEAGAAGSYGTVAEPGPLPDKFPNPVLLVDRYVRGATMLQAYWESVRTPGEGIFVGDPLARPFGSRASLGADGALTIDTTALDGGKLYRLLGADVREGPYTELRGAFTVRDTELATLTVDAPPPFVWLEEREDPRHVQVDFRASDDQSFPSISGPQVVFTDDSSGDADIAIRDRASGEISRLTTSPANQCQAVIEGDRVAWFDDQRSAPESDVVLYQRSTGSESYLTSTSVSRNHLRLSSHAVAWIEGGIFRPSLAYYDLAAEAFASVTAGLALGPEPFALFEDEVLVVAAEAGEIRRDVWRIDASDGARVNLTANEPDGLGFRAPALSANWAAWVQVDGSGTETLRLHDLGSGLTETIDELLAATGYGELRLSESWLTWEAHDAVTSNRELFAAHLRSGRQARIRMPIEHAFLPRSSGGGAALEGNSVVLTAAPLVNAVASALDADLASLSLTGLPAFASSTAPRQAAVGQAHVLHVVARDRTGSEVYRASLLDGSDVAAVGAQFREVPLGDLNDDGLVNGIDFFLLNNGAASGNPRADLNSDGSVNALDRLLLLSNFNSGEERIGLLEWTPSESGTTSFVFGVRSNHASEVVVGVDVSVP